MTWWFQSLESKRRGDRYSISISLSMNSDSRVTSSYILCGGAGSGGSAAPRVSRDRSSAQEGVNPTYFGGIFAGI